MGAPNSSDNRLDRLTPRPRITLVHYTAPPVVGGVEAVLSEQARLFAAAGCPTTVVAGRGSPSALGAAVRVTILPEMDLRHGGSDGFAPPAGQFEAACQRLERALGEALGPDEIVIAHNVLTTHFNLPLTAALFRLAEQGRLGRLIAWCHDISRYVNPASGAEQRQGAPWDWLRQYRPGVTYVAVSSARQQALAHILGCPPDVIWVVPNGVDPALLLGLSPEGSRLAEQFGLLAADLVLLMPIRITRAKNIEFGLRVAADLKAAGQRVRLVVTGPPDPHAGDAADYFETVRALRRSLELEEEAIFLSESLRTSGRPARLTMQRVAELYRLCDVVLMPSLREGFGMPVLEAGLAGKPIFATAMPAVQDVGPELVELIQPDESPQAVARRLLAWTETDARFRLRRLARQTFTWPAVFERWLQPLAAGARAPAGRAL